jgi:putative Mg2+ transporter-C (MgtC) family protein
MEGLISALWQGGTPALFALTFVLAAMIGIEREWHSHACGLRPCVLVAVGAAAYSDLIIGRVPESAWGQGFGAIVTGIGFLGAGAILKDDQRRIVDGLSTAATIWAVAISGLLIGARNVPSGVVLAVLTLLVNVLLRPVAEFLTRRSEQSRTADDVLDG